MGIFDFLKTDSFKSWKDVRSGLKCLDTERYRKQLEFILREGLDGQLTSIEKKNLYDCIAQATADNPKPLKNLPEPSNPVVTTRLCAWLDHVYNTKGHVTTPGESCSLTPIAISAPAQTRAAIEKAYRFVSERSGEPFSSGIITNMDEVKVETWIEKLYMVMGRPWIISSSVLFVEDALCIPSIAEAFSINPRLGMIQWKKQQLIVLKGQALNDGIIPGQLPVTKKLDPVEIGAKLRAKGWELEEN